MILVAHIVIALVSLDTTLGGVIRPSKGRLQTALVLFAATILSGSTLVFTSQVSLAHACVSGLIYTALAAGGMLYTNRKLSYAKVLAKNDRERD